MASRDAPARRSGKNEALTLETVYEAYGNRVLNLAYRLVGNEETARDICQDVFIKLHESLESFESRSHIYTWIYRITVNACLSFLKKQGRHRWLDLLDHKVSEIIVEQTVDPVLRGKFAEAASQHGRLEAGERAELVWRTIQTLAPKYRTPLVLHHYEGMSYKDIANTMALSMSAVEARIHRAKKQLIKKLEPWLDKV